MFVLCQLRLPVFESRLWCLPFCTFVTMPKTAVDKDGFLFPRKHKVRFAGKLFRIQTISVAKTMKQSSHDQFGPGVSRLHGLHDPTALFAAPGICHRSVSGTIIAHGSEKGPQLSTYGGGPDETSGQLETGSTHTRKTLTSRLTGGHSVRSRCAANQSAREYQMHQFRVSKRYFMAKARPLPSPMRRPRGAAVHRGEFSTHPPVCRFCRSFLLWPSR